MSEQVRYVTNEQGERVGVLFSNFTRIVHKSFCNSASINLSFAELCAAMGLFLTSFLESLPSCD